MRQLVVFPDATHVAIEALLAGFAELGDTTPVQSWVPLGEQSQDVAPLVTCLRSGGARRNLVVDDAQITVECWGGTDAAAADLAALAQAVLHAQKGSVIAGAAIYDVTDIAGPAPLPDPESGVSRQTFTVTMSLRGSTR